MRNPSRFVITRRQALQGASIAAVLLSTGAEWARTPTTQAAAPSAKQTASVAGSVAAVCFAADWATRFQVDFPAVVELAAPAKTDTAVAVEWDDRLFELAPTANVLRDNDIDSVDGITLTAGRMDLVVPAGATALSLQPRVRDIYPAENIGSPTPSAVTLGGATAMQSSSDAATAAPWGLELRVVWDESKGYSYPTQIEALSIGPNPVPPGVAIVARNYGSVSPLSSKLEGRASRGRPQPHNKVVDRTFALEAPLGQGDILSISLLPDTPGQGSTRASLAQVGQVFVTIPETLRPDARNTGRYSVASVTPSGTELTDSTISQKA